MKREKGLTTVEVMVLVSFLFVFLAGVGFVFIIVSASGRLEASLNQQEYITQAKVIADGLGDESRQGYGDGAWDLNDEKELIISLGLPANMEVDEVPVVRLKEFVRARE
jgi:hypothetical protein